MVSLCKKERWKLIHSSFCSCSCVSKQNLGPGLLAASRIKKVGSFYRNTTLTLQLQENKNSNIMIYSRQHIMRNKLRKHSHSKQVKIIKVGAERLHTLPFPFIHGSLESHEPSKTNSLKLTDFLRIHRRLTSISIGVLFVFRTLC